MPQPRFIRYLTGVILTLICPLLMAAPLQGELQPAAMAGRPGSLLILLHGYGSNAADLKPISHWVPENMVVVTLQAPYAIGDHRYAWYRNGKQQSADMQRSDKALAETITRLQQQLQISPEHTLIGGFSQGAVMSYRLALNHPLLISGAAIFSGRLPPADLLPEARSDSEKPRVFYIAHGRQDQVINYRQAEQAVRRLSEQYHLSAEFHEYAKMHHEITLAELTDFQHWLAKNH